MLNFLVMITTPGSLHRTDHQPGAKHIADEDGILAVYVPFSESGERITRTLVGKRGG